MKDESAQTGCEATSEMPLRRLFQFRLRTFFIALTVICIVCAWTVRQANWIKQRHIALAADGIQGNPSSKHSIYNKPYSPQWLWLFGEPGQVAIHVATDMISDARIEELRALFPEARMTLRGRRRRENLPPLDTR